MVLSSIYYMTPNLVTAVKRKHVWLASDKHVPITGSYGIVFGCIERCKQSLDTLGVGY